MGRRKLNDTHANDEIDLSLEHHDRASRRLRRLTFILTVIAAIVVAASFTIVTKTVSSSIRTVDGYQDRLDSCWAARKSLRSQNPGSDQ